ncbi:hypothetical protein CEXT_450611 [Caerostris extrusa]|uniref:Uncharacterized protein n=1 Tax=Caerostris extrusa TaxID=172846 RepID=A0AAV4UKD1_CAEEX|nr:hypothetical protein CEXT_450611 [Caerostris extrusa]
MQNSIYPIPTPPPPSYHTHSPYPFQDCSKNKLTFTARTITAKKQGVEGSGLSDDLEFWRWFYAENWQVTHKSFCSPPSPLLFPPPFRRFSLRALIRIPLIRTFYCGGEWVVRWGMLEIQLSV